MASRTDKHNYYLDIAQTVSERGTCLRRNYGAIIVNHDQIVSTGYTGAPRGRKNCIDVNVCTRKANNIPAGQRYELCRSVHAEANCIIAASRDAMIGGTLYLVGVEFDTKELVKDATSCAMCRRLIINAGIDKVIVRNTPTEYSEVIVRDWVFGDDTLDV